jgi:glutaredoxin
MKKVTVLRLSGCMFCEDLIEGLDNIGLEYEAYDADEHSKFADNIEAIVDTNAYPIVIVGMANENPYFLFRAEVYSEVGEVPIEEGVKVGTLSIGEMIEKILKLTEYAV